MSKKRFLMVLILPLIWIAFILGHSLMPGYRSSQESQWVLQLFSHIFPFEITETFIRKSAHFTEFSILGGIFSFFLTKRYQKWWKALLCSLSAGLFVALCDETIQLFIDGRAGLIQDVWIDTAGVLCGALLILLFRLIRGKLKKSGNRPQK